MLEKISSSELTEWMAFYQFEPFGTEVDFIGHAITASTIANANRERGTKAYKVGEFMPKFREPVQTVDEMLTFAQMYTLAMGGQDLRPEGDADGS